jgi:hypothetical protein
VSFALVIFSCGMQEKDDPTDLDVPTMEPPVAKNKPSGFSLLAITDSSPKICDSSSCPTVASTIENRLFMYEGYSISNILKMADSRLNELKQRSADQKVPCFETDSTDLSFTPVTGYTVTVHGNCYDNYSGPSGNDAGQIMFGKNGDTFYVADRYNDNSTSARSFWASQDASENVEVWVMGYDTANGNGTGFSHLLSKGTGTIEFTTAGGVSTGNTGLDLICGTQVKLNTSYIYVTGQIAAPSTTTTKTCASVSDVTYCLSTADFSEADSSNCTDAGLTSFDLTKIGTDTIEDSSWFSSSNFDYSSKIEPFSASPIDEPGGPLGN